MAAEARGPVTIFVTPDGSDRNPGTAHRPLRTVQAAVDAAPAGATVLVGEGTYHEQVTITRKRADNSHATVIRALGRAVITGRWELPVPDPSDEQAVSTFAPFNLGAALLIDDCDSLIIEGIETYDSSWFGIAARATTGLAIRSCRTNRSMASGIYTVGCDNVEVAYCEVTRACAYPERLPIGGHGSQECISIVDTERFEIHNNVIHESGAWTFYEPHGGGSGVGGEGIDVKEHSRNGSVHHNYVYNLSRLGLYADAWDAHLHDVTFHDNVVHTCKHGLALGCEAGGTIENIVVTNNLFYNCEMVGIHLASFGRSGIKRQIEISYNTVHRSGVAGIGLGTNLHRDITVTKNVSCLNPHSEQEEYARVDIDLGEAEQVTVEDNLTGTPPRFRAPLLGDFAILRDDGTVDERYGYREGGRG